MVDDLQKFIHANLEVHVDALRIKTDNYDFSKTNTTMIFLERMQMFPTVRPWTSNLNRL